MSAHLLDASALALVLVVVFVAARGLHEVSRRAGFTQARRRNLTAGTVLVALGWLGATASLASAGVFAVWTAVPPRVLLVPLSTIVALVAINRTATFRLLLGALPRWWPILLQSYRVFVELFFWGLYVTHRVPAQITFEGRNFDVLIGLSAPLVAYLVARGHARTPVILAWNALGLGLLVNVVVTAATSMPGPLHLDWPGEPLTEVARWPMIWVPAFLAPFAVLLHVVSLRQTLARSPRAVAERGAP